MTELQAETLVELVTQLRDFATWSEFWLRCSCVALGFVLGERLWWYAREAINGRGLFR